MSEKHAGGRPKTYSLDLPTYDSMSACTAAAHIPLSILKNAKRSGCKAFENGRVNLGILLEWLFSERNTEGVGDDCKWKSLKLKHEALREKRKDELEAKELILKDQAVRDVRTIIASSCAWVKHFATMEVPVTCASLPELKILEKLKEKPEEFKKQMRVDWADKEEQPAMEATNEKPE